MPIPLPPLEEQRSITDILDGVVEAIERVKTEEDTLNSLKVSVADALLTGRLRVAV